jgi:hypothetical protein
MTKFERNKGTNKIKVYNLSYQRVNVEWRANCSGSISALDLSCFGFSGCCGKSHLVSSGSLEGLHLRVAFTAWHVYPQRKTWSLEASYLLRLTFAYLDVERSSWPNINSSPATLLFLFQHLCVCGLTFHQWTPLVYVITLLSLHIQ